MDDITPGRAGVRAMALNPDGNMIDDFKIEYHNNALPFFETSKNNRQISRTLINIGTSYSEMPDSSWRKTTLLEQPKLTLAKEKLEAGIKLAESIAQRHQSALDRCADRQAPHSLAPRPHSSHRTHASTVLHSSQARSPHDPGGRVGDRCCPASSRDQPVPWARDPALVPPPHLDPAVSPHATNRPDPPLRHPPDALAPPSNRRY